MTYRKTFTDDPRMIALGVVLILIVAIILIFSILQLKIQKLKKFTRKRVNGICFLCGVIIGLAVSGSNGFRVFDEFHPQDFG